MSTPIHLFDIYRSPNIGIFLKANDKFCLVPRGLAETKCEKISGLLGAEVIQISIAGSRLIGPLAVLNSNGVIVSRLAEDEEIDTLTRLTHLNVARLNSRFTSVGNLIAANDRGAIVSDIIGEESVRTIEQTLAVPVRQLRIASHVQLGSMVATTNLGAIVHPASNEAEIEAIRKTLKVDPEAATVNGGVPFVSSGFVGNSKGALLGNVTRGGELVIIGRAFDSQ
ncbi:MAG: translation initiation factor IF-6 [Nitrososphaerales archaeon]